MNITKRLKQLRKMWKLTNKDPDYLKAIEELSKKDIQKIPKGNKQAEFIPFMNDQEKEEYIKDQDPFWQKINRKLTQIMK